LQNLFFHSHPRNLEQHYPDLQIKRGQYGHSPHNKPKSLIISSSGRRGKAKALRCNAGPDFRLNAGMNSCRDNWGTERSIAENRAAELLGPGFPLCAQSIVQALSDRVWKWKELAVTIKFDSLLGGIKDNLAVVAALDVGFQHALQLVV
jgi:hypothetical protein